MVLLTVQTQYVKWNDRVTSTIFFGSSLLRLIWTSLYLDFMLILIWWILIRSAFQGLGPQFPQKTYNYYVKTDWQLDCGQTWLRLNPSYICVCTHSMHTVHRCVNVHVSVCLHFMCAFSDMCVIAVFHRKTTWLPWVSGKGCSIRSSTFLVFPGRPCLCSYSLRSFLLTEDGVKFLLFIC